MIYTIGFQPIELFNSKHKIVDILNLIDQYPEFNRLDEFICEFLTNLNLKEDDYIFLNTIHTKRYINFVKNGKIILFNPPYMVDDKKIKDIIDSIVKPFKGEENINLSLINVIKEFLNQFKFNLTQDRYFSFLRKLSEITSHNFIDIKHEIENSIVSYDLNFKHYALFIGDIIEPKFFEYLNSKGIFVLKFFPYEFFSSYINSKDTIYNFYLYNPFFNHLEDWTLDINREINNGSIEFQNISLIPDMLIFNPGNVYLDNFTLYNIYLKKIKFNKIYILPGTYKFNFTLDI